MTGGLPTSGNVVMIGRKTEFHLTSSALTPGTLALYRANYGLTTLTELASGLSGDSKFQFRYGTPTYYNSVVGANLAQIDGIRIVAQSTGRGESGAKREYAFGWTVDIPLENAR